MQVISNFIETKLLLDKRKLVRIGSKINYMNTANRCPYILLSPRETSSNYWQVQEIVGVIDGEDSTVLLL